MSTRRIITLGAFLGVLSLSLACEREREPTDSQDSRPEASGAQLKKTKLVYYAIPG